MLVATADDRVLEVLTSGPEDGFPLVFHHGTPQGAVPFPLLERPAAQRGLRVISYSRPGYGQSTPRPDGASSATVADDVTDVVTVLDHLGMGEFVTLGWSGGGPRSLACAALLPGRCRAATCGVGIAPARAEGLDYLAGMGSDNVEELGAALAGAELLERWLEDNAPALFHATPGQVTEALGGLLPEVDRAAVTGELAEYLAASGSRAGVQGIVGWRDDDLTMTRPWGFDLDAISTPVAVWAGGQDLMVPFAHGQWLAAHVSGARAHLYPDEGHVSLLVRMDRILDDLLDLAGLADPADLGGSET